LKDAPEKNVARAIDALRRGWPVGVRRDAGASVPTAATTMFLPIETASIAQARSFDPGQQAAIIISAGRAATLNIANQRAAADPAKPVAIGRASWHDWLATRAIADPAHDLEWPMKGPFQARAFGEATSGDASGEWAEASAVAALELARLAGILPAFLMRQDGPCDVTIETGDVAAFCNPSNLSIITRAHLPIAMAETTEAAEIIAFRSDAGGDEHVALMIGEPGDIPLVRLHSECLTGDVFGSLKCDCGPQLRAALALMGKAGGGMLIYMRQEGRGIGLANKLRAYQLQDQGFDTVDANIRLGFAVDARDFGVAARMLTLLNAPQVRLLTNNPGKVDGLTANGIRVVDRIPHALPPNPHNLHYLNTKRERTGHIL
jgi:GTP cyclohydrolase II